MEATNNTNILMNTKEQWFGFYKSLRNILRNGDSKFSGMEAFNEINTLLILVLLEDKLDNFELDNAEMCKFRNIYKLFFTDFEERMKTENIKEPVLSRKRKENKIELFNYLYDKRRNYENISDEDGKIIYNQREYDENDIYLKHCPAVFIQILLDDKLSKLFTRTKVERNSSFEVYIISSFQETHVNDLYELIGKIAKSFYKIENNNIIESILKDEHLDFDALGSAYEKFMTDDTMNSKNTGEFFTRRDLISFIVNELNINENDIVYDSSLGTGGFLLEAMKVVKDKLLKDVKDNKITDEEHNEKFDNFLENNIHGNEIKPNLYKSLILNVLMHDPKGLSLNNLLCIDSMGINDPDKKERFENREKSLNFSTVSLGNPPYGVSLDNTPSDIKIKKEHNEEIYCEDGTSKENYFQPLVSGKNIIKNSSGQFIMHLIRCLKHNGNSGFIIDRGILINGTDKLRCWEKSLRKFLIEENNLKKVVLLPTGIFGHTNFATCVLFINKGGKTNEVIFQELYFKEEDKGVGTKPFYIGGSWKVKAKDIKDKKYSLNPKDYNIPLKEYEKKGGKQDNDEINNLLNKQFIVNMKWEKMNDIGEFLAKSKKPASHGKQEGKYPFFTSSNVCDKYCDEYDYEDECLIFGTGGTPNLKISNKFSCSADNIVVKFNPEIFSKYLYYYFKINIKELEKGFVGNGLKHISKKYIQDIIVPIPSLENQQKIVNKLNEYFGDDSIYKFNLETIMKYENGNKLLNFIFNEELNKFLECVQKAQQLDDLKYIPTTRFFTELGNRTIVKFNPETKSKTKTNIDEFVMEIFLKKEFEFITKDMEFESKKIGDLYSLKSGDTLTNNNIIQGIYPVIGGGKVFKGFHNQYNTDENNIFIARVGDAGLVSFIETKCFCTDNCIKLTPLKNNVINKFIYYCLKIDENYLKSLSGKNGQPNINQTVIKNIVVNIPKNILDQNKIVKYLDNKIDIHKNYWLSMINMFSNETSNNIEENQNEESNEDVLVV